MTYEQFISNILESRSNNWFPYSERHHIIPRCMGGSDEDSNLIYLTLQEHFIAHKLLAEENPEDPQLLHALWWMSNRGSVSTPEEYEDIRRKYIDMFSKSQKERFLDPLERQKAGNGRRGKSAPNKGVACSEAQKRSISSTLRSKYASKEIIHPMLGKTHTEDSKRKISQSLSNPTEETRQKHRDAARQSMKGNTYGLGRIWVCNGTESRMIYPEELGDFLSKGYIKGRSMKRR